MSSAALAKAKAFGLVAAALAAGGAGGTIALSHLAPAPSTKVQVSADAHRAQGPAPEAVRPTTVPTSSRATGRPDAAPTSTTPAASTPTTSSGCSGVRNHGSYVRGHGSGTARSAAHSECGKPAPTHRSMHPAHPAHHAAPAPQRSAGAASSTMTTTGPAATPVDPAPTTAQTTSSVQQPGSGPGKHQQHLGDSGEADHG